MQGVCSRCGNETEHLEELDDALVCLDCFEDQDGFDAELEEGLLWDDPLVDDEHGEY
jgi:hypothetical protein